MVGLSFQKKGPEISEATDASILKILISHAVLFPLKGCLLSANGAVFIASLGQVPQDRWCKKISALKTRLSEPRFQRFVSHMIRIPRALPQAHLRRAPLALDAVGCAALFPR